MKTNAVMSALILVSSACAPNEAFFDENDELTAETAARLTADLLQQRGGVGDVPAADLSTTRGVVIDRSGDMHTRVVQRHHGVAVLGGEVIVHLERDGSLKSLTDGLQHGVVADETPAVTREQAINLAAQAAGGWPKLGTKVVAELQVLKVERGHALTWRVKLENAKDEAARLPVVFVDAASGDVVLSYDNLQTARNRQVYNLSHGTALPGALARAELQAAIGENDVDTNHARLGSVYDCYSGLFGRDSFDNAGAPLISSVHYSSNYVNAFWNGAQMVYGDGDNIHSRSLALSMDVTAHELTHAVTERSSGLIYAGESGGLNEAMSDIFGNVCEWYRDNNGDPNGPTSANTWMVGEDIWLAAPALRFMNDPARDGASLDYWTSSAGNVDVHYSSGIANLAFYLLANGGTHPRGKSTIQVNGIGIRDAARIFYRANTVHLTPSARFSDARGATVAAAVNLFGADSAQAVQTSNAWAAVGVAAPVAYTVIDTKPDLSGALASTQFFSYATRPGATAMRFDTTGGTGDADLYVRFGAPPSLTAYDCRPYAWGNAESCEINPLQSGTYYVMVHGYSAYSGMTLTVRSAGGLPATETSCTDGIDNDGDGSADCADSDCVSFPACIPAKVVINEILANEPGTNTAKEFVELVNVGGQSVDLSGWRLIDSTAVRHTFAAGTRLAAGKSIVVFAGAGAIPPGLSNAVAASTGELNLSNSGDTVTLKQGTVVVDRFVYAGALAAVDGVSMNRSPDATAGAPFQLHTSLSTLHATPGVRANGTPF